MSTIEQIDKLAEELEKQELEAQNGATPQIYEKLLAIYLYQNDLCNAKYLWKRIPASVKSATPELGLIWAVGQYMWKREFSLVYNALTAVNWSETVADIMKLVQDKVRLRAVALISHAYSSITLDTIALMTGLTPEVAATACRDKGWEVDTASKIVHPVVCDNNLPSGHISSEDQLYKLTDFVSFLEN